MIVNADSIGRLPLRLVVPITEWNERYCDYDWMVRLTPTPHTGLSKLSAADAFQTRSVSLERFVERLGKLDPDRTERIATAVALCVDAP